ncbi:hypothetical protein [Massilia sp. TS11]|uniref:hypothetical protein n=1 Tax=Massilia sp. TS11 TaxID=2908003 RepID=UPI001EDC5667|nr:hypothetical protein [Massilia sp. TS11]MCG2586785.1 hypothetical protein [Massilia sp. TS11]
MKQTLLKMLLLSVCLASQPVLAASLHNQIPSCYAAGKLEVPAPASVQALFIVLDETVVLDDSLQRALWDAVRPQLQPGTQVAVYRFSAFSQGRYLDGVAGGTLEAPIDARLRDSISVPKLRQFDSCLKGQAEFGQRLVREAIGKVLAASTSTLARSDILSSLSALSQQVAAAQAGRRKVLLVSDMLENSSISSFYQNGGVRRIDPNVELKKLEQEKLTADFGGAEIYVMGAGLIGGDTKSSNKGPQSYRDPKTMAALKSFWDTYFRRSHADLIEFGAPALLAPLR